MNSDIVVSDQLLAYNKRDIESFASYFASDIQLYNYGEDKPFLTGIDNLREVYAKVFEQSPNLNCIWVNKMILNDVVIYHEKVTGRVGKDLVEVLAIYEIKDDLIKRLTFVR